MSEERTSREKSDTDLTELQNQKLEALLSPGMVGLPFGIGKREALAVIKSQLSMEVDELSNYADEVLEKAPELSDTDVSIALLNRLAETRAGTKLGKIARKMLDEKWWEKDE